MHGIEHGLLAQKSRIVWEYCIWKIVTTYVPSLGSFFLQSDVAAFFLFKSSLHVSEHGMPTGSRFDLFEPVKWNIILFRLSAFAHSQNSQLTSISGGRFVHAEPEDSRLHCIHRLVCQEANGHCWHSYRLLDHILSCTYRYWPIGRTWTMANCAFRMSVPLQQQFWAQAPPYVLYNHWISRPYAPIQTATHYPHANGRRINRRHVMWYFCWCN
jgi:hypothetical protein